MIEFIQQPWHWAFSGFMIALIMFFLLYFGKTFGISDTLRTICAMGGAGKKISFFDYNWREQVWNLVFALGAVLGGFIASSYLMSPEPLAISSDTINHLAAMNIHYPTSVGEGQGYLPLELFTFEVLCSPKGLLLFVGGGFLVGFGARYAGGCTSGHAISGISNLQIPSVIAVIGFFIGGLLMTHFILPLIFSL